MDRLEHWVHRVTFRQLGGKKLWWSKRIRVFCDNGVPIFRWVPRFRRQGYHPRWRMFGFAVYWLGREFNFSFGVDHNGLFK